MPQATGTEADIVDRLRSAQGLTLSLVAEAGAGDGAEDGGKNGGKVIGYLAASEGRIGAVPGWGVIGPLAVLPSCQGQGIGSTLMAEAIRRLRMTHKGAALVGDPRYYARFGFRPYPGVTVGGCPPEVVPALPFAAPDPTGEVIHHPAFGLTQQT